MHAQLDHANLSAVNLSNARLDHAHLGGATLTNANLRRARLRFTTLSTADLQAADMSDADLMHAKLDQADLSAANFKNARLDYADFAGAKLSKVNLSGACLRHAKNLTRSQLEESTGSVSTILPPHLQGSVPWSPVLSPAVERYDPSGLQRVIAGRVDAHFTSGNQQRLNLYDTQHWGAAGVVTIAALVIPVLIWQCATMLNDQWKSEQATNELSFPSEALTKNKNANEILVRIYSAGPRADAPSRVATCHSSHVQRLGFFGSRPWRLAAAGGGVFWRADRAQLARQKSYTRAGY